MSVSGSQSRATRAGTVKLANEERLRRPTKARSPASRDKAKSKGLGKVVSKSLASIKKAGLIASSGAKTRYVNWIKRMLLGNQTDFRTPFFSKRKPGGKGLIHKSYSEVAAGWEDRMKSVNVAELGFEKDHLDVLMDVENSALKKFGPKSVFRGFATDGPEKVKAIYSDKPKKKILNERAYNAALDWLVSLVPPKSVVPISLEEAIKGRIGREGTGFDADGMDISTNSGPPWNLSGWKPRPETPEEKLPETEACWEWIQQRVRQVTADMQAGKAPHWSAMVFQRLVSVGDNPEAQKKQKRIVIGLEKAEAIIGKTISMPLQDKLREVVYGGIHPFIGLYDIPHIYLEQQKMLRLAEDKGLTVLSCDFDSFDATIPPWVLVDVGKVIDAWLVNDFRLAEQLFYAIAYQTTLVTPLGVIKEQPSSQKSGSWQTLIGNCLVNLLNLRYGHELGEYQLDAAEVLGDDATAFGEGLNPESYAKTSSHLGLKVNPKKQLYVRRALLFLQRFHILGFYGGIASASRTLLQTLNYERLSYSKGAWNAKLDVIRALSQLENAAFSPYFKALVEYIAENDRFELGRHMSPAELMREAGSLAGDVISADVIGAWKSGNEDKGFSAWAVNGVLRNEPLGKLGSYEYFKRVFGERTPE